MNNTLRWILGTVAVLAIGFAIFKYSSDTGKPPTLSATTHETSPGQALPAGTVVYDVRTPQEYAISHGKGAVLLPLAELQSGKQPGTAKTSSIAVYCRSGNRSAQAAKLLRDAGYQHVIDIGAIDNLEHYGIDTVNE